MRGYNQSLYNAIRYNASGSDLTLTDETIGIADLLLDEEEFILRELLIMTDGLTKQVTAKVLIENLRIADWLSIDRTSPQNEWYD